jgi:hypothetical protein
VTETCYTLIIVDGDDGNQGNAVLSDVVVDDDDNDNEGDDNDDEGINSHSYQEEKMPHITFLF